MNEELKNKLEQAYKILYMEGLAEDTTRGHATAKGEDQRIYIKPWGMGFEEVTAQDFLGVDLDGNLLEGKGRLHGELPLHLEIYRRRQDVTSIVHVHPFHSVILSSVIQERMKMVGQHGMHFVGKLPIYESAELIYTKRQGTKLAQILGERPAVLMRNHGMVTVGRMIEEAVISAIDFEKAAKEHLMASLFKKTIETPSRTAEKMNADIYSVEQFTMLWNYYCRKLDRIKV
jgi:L-fuculose-phosphate aldolase